MDFAAFLDLYPKTRRRLAMSSKAMTIADKTLLVTGANRGLGQSLVEEALRRGAKRVYAGTRRPFVHSDERVTPLTLDVTDAAQVETAVRKVESLDVLINNAGVAIFDDLSDRAALERHLAVNPVWALACDGGFSALADPRSRRGRQRSVGRGLRSSSSHAGLLDLEGRRTLADTVGPRPLGGHGVTVHAVLAGPIDTDMSRELDVPKTAPESVASAIFDGVAAGEEDIFPDPMSNTMAESWRTGAAKQLERQNAALVEAQTFAGLSDGGEAND
jgi:NAD(P)-dependent dehydrogenase (short-subunit alcohol dehydrogenase family)